MGLRTEDEGIFVGPADGNNLTNPIGGGMVVKVRDGDTAGAYSVHDNTIPPGSPGPRPHLHRHHEEAFYVLKGELTVRVGPRCNLRNGLSIARRGWTKFTIAQSPYARDPKRIRTQKKPYVSL